MCGVAQFWRAGVAQFWRASKGSVKPVPTRSRGTMSRATSSQYGKKHGRILPSSSHPPLPRQPRSWALRARLHVRRGRVRRGRGTLHAGPPTVLRLHALRASPARSGPGEPVARRSPSRMRRVAGIFTTTQRRVSLAAGAGHAKPSRRNTRSDRSPHLGRSLASRMRGGRVSRYPALPRPRGGLPWTAPGPIRWNGRAPPPALPRSRPPPTHDAPENRHMTNHGATPT